MVEVLERGAALAEAASRTAGRRKRDILAVWVVVVRFGERIGGEWICQLECRPQHEREKRRKRRNDPTTTRCSGHDEEQRLGRGTRSKSRAEAEVSEVGCLGGIAVSQHASKKAGDFRSSSLHAPRGRKIPSTLNPPPLRWPSRQSVWVAQQLPAGCKGEHRPTKASVGLSPGPASSPNG